MRKKFTEWYVRRGYTFVYSNPPSGVTNVCFDCPLWVKPLLFLFSPSVYMRYEESGKNLLNGFLDGLGIRE